MKTFKLSSAKPPTQKHILALLSKEVSELRKTMESLSLKIGDNGRRFVFKSTVPKTKDGKSIAQIRNDISHIRCCANSIKCGTAKYKK